jgi:hypothetical protein
VSLAAEAGVIAFKTAYARWVSEPEDQDLSALIREALGQLKVLTAGQNVRGVAHNIG